jgi:hypothetical protein
VAYRLPAGSHVVAEIHYRGARERIVDQGTLGLFFADEPAPTFVSDLVLEAKPQLSAGRGAQRFRGASRLTADTYVLALRPEILPGVKSIEVAARKPDGGTEILLFAKDFPIDWPTPYIYKEPVLVPRGSELSVTTYSANDTPAAHAAGVGVPAGDRPNSAASRPVGPTLKNAIRLTVSRFSKARRTR